MATQGGHSFHLDPPSEYPSVGPPVVRADGLSQSFLAGAALQAYASAMITIVVSLVSVPIIIAGSFGVFALLDRRWPPSPAIYDEEQW